jgi:CheY-like chemotaxis protein
MNTILVIEDNEDYREGLVQVLKSESYRVLDAKNGLIGLEMIQLYTPNLIVCDLDMPMMNGLEVLRAVKADPFVANIPFLILTGHSDKQSLNSSRDLGVEAYLNKPIAIPEFLAAIASFLKVNKTLDMLECVYQ